MSKNFFVDPTVDGAGWRLEIGGQVDRPYSLAYDDLRALPAVEDVRTLMCISNEVGGDLIGNAQWRGVRLRDLLERAGPRAGAFKVVFTCADDYQDSVRFTQAMQPETLVVYEMNGEPLTPKHGYPARLLIPGIYGMKNVKWVRQIEVLGRRLSGGSGSSAGGRRGGGQDHVAHRHAALADDDRRRAPATGGSGIRR